MTVMNKSPRLAVWPVQRLCSHLCASQMALTSSCVNSLSEGIGSSSGTWAGPVLPWQKNAPFIQGT